MLKQVLGSLVLLGALGSLKAEPFHCSSTDDATLHEAVCYISGCLTSINEHIKQELNAAFSYMLMAAHFDDTNIARPGMAKFLYESASEERQHAILMLDYLNKRGKEYTDRYTFNSAEKLNYPIKYDDALKAALKMEILVTNRIERVLDACKEDFHAADFFTDPIMAEQHDGIRKLQGAIQTFKNLGQGTNPTAILSEYLFDKNLLENGL